MLWLVSDRENRDAVWLRLQEVKVWSSMMGSSFATCEDMFTWQECQGAYGYEDVEGGTFVCCKWGDTGVQVCFYVMEPVTRIVEFLGRLRGPRLSLSYEGVCSIIRRRTGGPVTPAAVGELIGMCLGDMMLWSMWHNDGVTVMSPVDLAEESSWSVGLLGIVILDFQYKVEGTVMYRCSVLSMENLRSVCSCLATFLRAFVGSIVYGLLELYGSVDEVVLQRRVNGVFRELVWGFYRGCAESLCYCSVLGSWLDLNKDRVEIFCNEVGWGSLKVESAYASELGFNSCRSLLDYVWNISGVYSQDGLTWFDVLRGRVSIS